MDRIIHSILLRFVKLVEVMIKVSAYYFCWMMFGLVKATRINLVFVTSENPRFGVTTIGEILLYSCGFWDQSACQCIQKTYQSTGPAFDIAIENMKRKFPEVLLQRNQIHRYEVYKPGIFSCDEAGVEMQFVAGKMANLVQQLEGFVVLLCAGTPEASWIITNSEHVFHHESFAGNPSFDPATQARLFLEKLLIQSFWSGEVSKKFERCSDEPPSHDLGQMTFGISPDLLQIILAWLWVQPGFMYVTSMYCTTIDMNVAHMNPGTHRKTKCRAANQDCTQMSFGQDHDS